MKKILITLGTIGMVVSPSLTLISCSDDKTNTNTTNNNINNNAIKERSIRFSHSLTPEAFYQLRDITENVLVEAFHKSSIFLYSSDDWVNSDVNGWDNLEMLSLSSKGELVFEMKFVGENIVQNNQRDNIIIKKGQIARFEVSNVEAFPFLYSNYRWLNNTPNCNPRWRSTKLFLDNKLITKSFALNDSIIQPIIQMYKQSKWITILLQNGWTTKDAWSLVWGFMSNRINAIGKSAENANNVLNDNEILDFVTEISKLKLLAHGNIRYEGINGRDVFLFSGSTNGKKYLGANGSTSVTNSFLSKDLFKSQLRLTDEQINTISYVIVPVSSDLYSFGGKFNPTNGSISPNVVLRNLFLRRDNSLINDLPNALDKYPITPPDNSGFSPVTSSNRKK